MSKKIPIKGRFRRAETTQALILTPPKGKKKASRHVTADKATSCFDGAGDLNPTKTKSGQSKKR